MIANIVRNVLHPLSSRLTSEQDRLEKWKNLYRHFDDNPFCVDPSQISPQTYIELAKKTKSRDHSEFIKSIEKGFGFLPTTEFIDELALSTQIVLKQSELVYLHGYLLYAALRRYLLNHPDITQISILETGTARGFSALCMAKAMQEAVRNGRIITIDVLPVHKQIYWNCIHDSEGKKSRFELLSKWKDLVETYIIFLRGHTDIVLQQLGLKRIHFAFLDSGHDYKTLTHELNFVASHQQQGDVIICDDYTQQKYPGVVRAVDELLATGIYTGQLFKSEVGRNYMYCERK